MCDFSFLFLEVLVQGWVSNFVSQFQYELVRKLKVVFMELIGYSYGI